MFIGLIFMYVKISNKLFPKDSRFRNTVLILLICLTPNYKAFMMFRGEPFVTLLIAVMVYFLIQLYQEEYELNFLNSLLFGALIGLIALSRQWGFCFFLRLFFLLLFLEINFHLKYFLVFLQSLQLLVL